jgi:pimeloyl-ACP methyl ester carboxylesterase
MAGRWSSRTAGGLTEDSPFLAALARRWRVFGPLLPGYGDSEGAAGLCDMLAVTLHTFDVIDALELDRPILVGHSMGGMIAAEMAAVATCELEHLGLIAPAGLWLDPHPVPDLFSKLPHELPALLFHDPAFGERVMTAGTDLDDPKFLEALIVRKPASWRWPGNCCSRSPIAASTSGSTGSAPRPCWSRVTATGLSRRMARPFAETLPAPS